MKTWYPYNLHLVLMEKIIYNHKDIKKKQGLEKSLSFASEGEMLKNFFKICFTGAVLAFLAVSLVKAVLAPTEINSYEMRYAERMPALSAAEYLKGDFQTQMDSALGDQILFSNYYKKFYNEISSKVDGIFTPLRHSISDRYLNYKGAYIYNGQLINPTVPLEDYRQGLKEAAEYINAELASVPGVEFYLYYVENDSDIYFETARKTGTYEYFASLLDMPEENIARFEVNSFDEYHELFYTGDHHWNHKGSYKAYIQLLNLLKGEGEALVPEEEMDVPGIFIGSKALLTGNTQYAERMKAYRYPFPEIEIYVNGERLPYHGELENLMRDGGDYCSYTSIYGDDLGCAIMSTGNEAGEKLLVLGDSYDNAVLKPLACHFGQLHSVDARYYPVQTGKLLDISDYVTENDIDKVLILGCNAFFDIRMGLEW